MEYRYFAGPNLYYDSLRFYQNKTHYNSFTQNDYKAGDNMFTYIFSHGGWMTSPHPEGCSTLYTDKNIRTTGIVIGSNIESHVSNLNNLSNTVSNQGSAITIIKAQIVQINSEIADIKSDISALKVEAGFALGISCASAGFQFLSKAGSVLMSVGEDAEEVVQVGENAYARLGRTVDDNLGFGADPLPPGAGINGADYTMGLAPDPNGGDGDTILVENTGIWESVQDSSASDQHIPTSRWVQRLVEGAQSELQSNIQSSNDNSYVNQNTQINGKTLDGDIDLTGSDLQVSTTRPMSNVAIRLKTATLG
jgi:hypothetical protein